MSKPKLAKLRESVFLQLSVNVSVGVPLVAVRVITLHYPFPRYCPYNVCLVLCMLLGSTGKAFLNRRIARATSCTGQILHVVLSNPVDALYDKGSFIAWQWTTLIGLMSGHRCIVIPLVDLCLFTMLLYFNIL